MCTSHPANPAVLSKGERKKIGMKMCWDEVVYREDKNFEIAAMN